MRSRGRRPLLLLVVIACVCAVLVYVSARHESLFASSASSEFANALRDDAIDLDDDDDSSDMPSIALEAAQQDAARLLDSFDAGAFSADDDDEIGEEGDDVEIADAAGEEEERETPVTDASVGRVGIDFHRSDATLEDAEPEVGGRVVYEEADELSESEYGHDADERVESIQLDEPSDDNFVKGDLWRPDETEREDEEEDTGCESSGISKRVGAVFLKVRGVIFPNGDTKTTEDARMDTEEPAQTLGIETELLSDIHGELQIDAPSSSYRKSTAVIEQISSFFEASSGQSEFDKDLSGLVIGLERSEYDALEVEVQSAPAEVKMSSSEEEDAVVMRVAIVADEAEGVAYEAEETIAVAVANTVASADLASDHTLDQVQSPEQLPVDLNNVSPTSMDSAYESIGSTVNSFQEITLEMATAAEQMVMALRHGHRPQLLEIFAEARAKAGAGVKAVMDPATDAFLLLQGYLAVVKTELSAGLASALVHLSNLCEYLKLIVSEWSQHLSSANRQVSQWCWEMWSTYKEVRILGRNLYGLVLLALCGLVFFSLYRVVAAIPEFLCTYFLTFDEVTRAQLKIFSAVLLVVLVYHASTRAWFWLLLSAALGYYYWSGHVVISVKFKRARNR